MGDEITPKTRHVLYAVRVIVEKQPLDNVWQPFRWVISDLLPLQPVAGTGAPPINNTRLQRLRGKGGGAVADDLFFADAFLDLHHAEAEAYAENLASSDPAIYLVLRSGEDEEDDEGQDDLPDGDDDAPDMHVAELSLSPYNIQDYEDCGEDLIEKLPLAGPIRQFVADFVDAHYHPEPFKKRVRDRANLDAHVGGRADPRLRRH
jgi:hypothetical protein|tara:strand:- start:798 stop:1412 length:615 start_codon:yes stop_codon:yes gene_type:complete